MVIEKQNSELNSSNNSIKEEHPPIFGTWQRVYIFVILNLIVFIMLFFLFSRSFE